MSDIDRDNAGTRNTATAYRHKGRGRRSGMQTTVGDAAERITASARAIERNAQRQGATVEIIVELERRARDIGEITQTVSRISDQTNLLALNAAIEAARAGDHGRGFAVVADEVRALAETSDKSAQEVKKLAGEIQADVGGVVGAVKTTAEMSATEAKTAAAVVETLEKSPGGHAANRQGERGNAERGPRSRTGGVRSAEGRRAGRKRRRTTICRREPSPIGGPAAGQGSGSGSGRRTRASGVGRKASRRSGGRICSGADRRDCRRAFGDDPGTDERCPHKSWRPFNKSSAVRNNRRPLLMRLRRRLSRSKTAASLRRRHA